MKLIHPEKAKGKSIVVIVGAGFAGLNAAKSLSKNSKIHVILLDQKNHHLFQPLLYQVATAGLNPADIAVPIRGEFSDVPNVEVHLAKVDTINAQEQTIHFVQSELEITYDYLVLACGAMHSYFANPEWEEFAPGLKTLEQAVEIRRRLFLAFENAENELEPTRQKEDLNFVIVGGGPTGVELAGAIAEISRKILVDDFRRFDSSKAKVILIEAGPRILSMFSEETSKKACRDLAGLGVDIRTATKVEKIDTKGVYVKDGFIPSESIFWAAGVQARPMKFQNEAGLERDRAGRIKVEKDLSTKASRQIFVIGDMAAVEMGEGKFVPGLAPAAIQQGHHVAKVIEADLQNRPRPDFAYLDKGSMATIGKNKAVLEIKKLKMSGRLAWLAWMFIHIFYLVGFKNRFVVLLSWCWSYVFSKRVARIITDKNWRIGTRPAIPSKA